MNREEILAMNGWRELDSLVIGALDFDLSFSDDKGHWVRICKDEDPCLFRPSLNIRDAWETIGKMGDSGWMLYKLAHALNSEGKINGYTCIFLNIETGASREATAVIPSKAICKAALLAVMEEEKK